MADIHIKILGTPLGGSAVPGKMPTDGDGDGLYTSTVTGEDNVPVATAVREMIDIMRMYSQPIPDKRTPEDVVSALKDLVDDEGFTRDNQLKAAIKTGYSVARDKTGLKLAIDQLFDKNGRPMPDTLFLLDAWLMLIGREDWKPKDGAREVGVGGWINVEDGFVYLDMVDILDNTEANREIAIEWGKSENQYGIGDLDVYAQKRDGFINIGGTGGSYRDPAEFTKLIEAMKFGNSGDIDGALGEIKNDQTGLLSHIPYRIVVTNTKEHQVC